MRAGCFIGVIILGYALRRVGVFKESDFKVLSTLVIKVTLPAAIVSSFNGKVIDPSMLSIALIGFGCGVVHIISALVMNMKKGREQQAFEIVSASGCSIGTFTLPFIQNFMGPMGVITTSIFDTGNACICLGGAYSMAFMVKDGSRFSVKTIVKKLSRSVAFDCYVVLLLANFLHVQIPTAVFSFADLIANANAFAAMFMIGVGFKLSGDRKQIGTIARILAVRYSFALVIGLSCFYFLPFSLEIRQALLILPFSPIASAAPGFAAELEADVGLASALNSISIVCSMIIMVVILMITL